jgi:hypothetical protein
MIIFMKISGILTIVFLLCISRTAAQYASINALRFLDDNHALATDSNDWKFHRDIKEISLCKQNSAPMFSFGGEIREQLRYFHNINFGLVSPGVSPNDFYLQQRYMLHADVRLNRFLRLFTQMNSCHVTGKNIVSPQTERDDLGIMQAFVELTLEHTAQVQVRLGRQEIMLGQERMLGLREGPTVRQAFNGARMIVEMPAFTGTLLLVQPVYYNFGVFDNTRREQEYIFAAYGSVPLSKTVLLDVYYFALGFQNANYANEIADEVRHATGLRLSRGKGPFTFDAEFTWQFGQFGHQDIRAWQLSSFFAYRWQGPRWHPRILIREALYSGDRKAHDGMINTFRPASTKSPVHDLNQIGSANLALISPELEVVLSEQLAITLRYLTTARLSGNDGLYPPDGRIMVRPTDRPGEELGKSIFHGFTAECLYRPNKHITVLVYGGFFQADEYISNIGGVDMEGLSIRAAYKF